MATTCASVNEPSSDVPRCPDVPNATGAAGRLLAVGREQRVDVDEVGGLREGPGTLGDRHPPDPAAAARRPCHWSKATAMRIRAPMMICR